MNYFRYGRSPKASCLIEAYEAIAGLKKYALSIYVEEMRVDDVLDKAYHHIIDRFDENSGKMSNYAISVVSKIGINNNVKEYNNTELVEDVNLEHEKNNLTEYDKFVYDDKWLVEDCIQTLIPIYIKDFGFFTTGNKKLKKISAKHVLEKYSAEIILDAFNYLKNNYENTIRTYYNVKSLENKRHFSDNIEFNKTDNTISIVDIKDGIIKFKRNKKSKIEKKFYILDIENVIDNILETFYDIESEQKAFLDIEGYKVYITLLGKEVYDIQDLIESIEKDLIGTLLVNNQVKIIRLENGNPVFISRKDLSYLTINIFDKQIQYPLIEIEGIEVA